MEARKLILRILLTTAVVIISAGAILLLFRGFRLINIFFGFVFGVFTSAINFWLLSLDMSRTRYAPRERIESWLLGRFLMRYVFIGGGVAICLFYPRIHIIGYLAGFLVFQLAIFWSMFGLWKK